MLYPCVELYSERSRIERDMKIYENKMMARIYWLNSFINH